MLYMPVKLKTEVNIEEIVAIHYFEYPGHFVISDEMHNAWEVVYSDKDSLLVTVRAREEIVPPGHYRIISPMELHSVCPLNGKSANAVIFSFVCKNEKLFKSAGKTVKCDSEKKEFLSKLVAAAKDSFSTPLGEPFSTRLVKSPHASVGAENLLKIYMELFILSCIREDDGAPVSSAPLSYTSNPFLAEVCMFLEGNVTKDIDFPALCEEFKMSKTNMKKLFRDNLGIGAMDYFSRCKIDCAKRLIREKEMNLAEISSYLAFSSQQYFSRRFRSVTGMTPSEYMYSIV